MNERIISPVDEVVSELSLLDRLDRFAAALSEFSDTLDGSGRFFLFDMVREEFATLKSDLNIYIRFHDACGPCPQEEQGGGDDDARRRGQGPGLSWFWGSYGRRP